MIAADANVVQKIVDLAPIQTFELKDALGVTTMYTSKPVHEVKADAPELPKAVSVVTLNGFADLVRAKIEGKDLTSFVVHVENEKTVSLKSTVSDQYGRRLKLIQAQPVEFEQFQFGKWIRQEEFVIGVASRFAETEDKAYVLDVASTLTSDATSTSEDNGFTQKATIKAGMKVKESVTLKPQVMLAPFRTFPEVGQPISSFVFRARCDGESGPVLMLVEADGGKWKLDAINEVRRALAVYELDIPIIA